MAACAPASPLAALQPAMYWQENEESRWTNAVAAFGTRLIAPPYASSSTEPPAGVAARASTARTSASIPIAESWPST